jgi:hypothetical protein
MPRRSCRRQDQCPGDYDRRKSGRFHIGYARLKRWLVDPAEFKIKFPANREFNREISFLSQTSWQANVVPAKKIA